MSSRSDKPQSEPKRGRGRPADPTLASLWDRAADLARDGKSLTEIGLIIERSPSTVSRYLRRRGVKPAHPLPDTGVVAARNVRILQSRALGKTYRQLSDEFGLSISRIGEIIGEYGKPWRKSEDEQ